jgi:RNA 2',3'-cyclic 3'-phosphodiesterase
MRLFTAIPIPEETKKKIAEVTRGRLPVHYINLTNLHITLNFFGELDSDGVDRLKQIWNKSLGEKKPFEIHFDKIVKFHQQIHITIKSNPNLTALQNDLEQFYVAQDFTFQDRSYYPHVKLANMHMDKVMDKTRKMENFPNQELAALDFKVTKIVLYESKLLLHHAHHTPVDEFTLN